MAFTHTIQNVWQQGNNTLSHSVTKSADGETNRQVSVPDSSANLLINFTLDVSELKSLYLVSDKDLTLETNSGSSPVDTIALKAGEPLIWWTGSAHDNPFSADVTALYATTGAVGTATLEIRALHDSTP